MDAGGYKALTKRELGRYLRFYRSKAGFTAMQVAQELGYASQQSIFNIESGKSAISAEKLFDYLRLCGIDPDEAFTEPFEEVDRPSRVKKPGSVRVREMTEVYQQLDSDNQRTVLKVAKWALEAQGPSSAGSGSGD